MNLEHYRKALQARLTVRAKAVQTSAPAGQSWYRFVRNAATPTEAEVLIYDEIGFWGITAKDFVRDLAAVSAETLTVRLNSPGGDVFDGIAIHNALKAYAGTVKVKVDGLAASIASVIAMAGQSIEMRQGSFLMLHHPWAFVIGNASDMRQMAATLDKIGGSLIDIYAARSKQSADDVRALMDAVTWLNADDAIAKGFADTKTDEAAVEAAWDLSVYGAVPPSLPAPQVEPAQAAPAQESTYEPDRSRMARRLALITL